MKRSSRNWKKTVNNFRCRWKTRKKRIKRRKALRKQLRARAARSKKRR